MEGHSLWLSERLANAGQQYRTSCGPAVIAEIEQLAIGERGAQAE